MCNHCYHSQMREDCKNSIKNWESRCCKCGALEPPFIYDFYRHNKPIPVTKIFDPNDPNTWGK